MKLKQAFLPLYAIAIIATITNANLFAMEGVGENTSKKEKKTKKIETTAPANEETIKALTETAHKLQAALTAVSDTNTINHNEINIALGNTSRRLDGEITKILNALAKNNADLDALRTRLDNVAKDVQKLQPKPKGVYTFFNLKVLSPAKLAIASLILPFGRLMYKDEPAENPMGFKEGAKGLVTINPLSTRYYTHAWKFIDDFFIGFKGKKRGFAQPTASRLTYDGQKAVAKEFVRPTANGATEKVTYSSYGNTFPYGLLGNAFAYFATIAKGNDLTQGLDNAQWAYTKLNK